MVPINSTLKVEVDELTGLFRVLANNYETSLIYLGFMGAIERKSDSDLAQTSERAVGSIVSLDSRLLCEWINNGSVAEVNVQFPNKLLLDTSGLTSSEQKIFERRVKIMTRFLHPQLLEDSLGDSGGLGGLVRESCFTNQCSRSTVYRLWSLLCRYGLEARSLNPRFELCGAPGKIKPWQEGRPKVGRKILADRLGVEVKNPQVGVTEEMRKKILHYARALTNSTITFEKLYKRIIDEAFVRDYQLRNKGFAPVFLLKEHSQIEGRFVMS